MVSMSKRYDPDERFKVDSDPEAAIKDGLEGAGATDEDCEMDESEDED
jgi:hypothetical protein